MSNFIEHLKENKVLMGLIIGMIVLFAFFTFQIVSQNGAIKEAKAERSALHGEILKLEREIAKREGVLKDQKNEVIVETTGLDPQLVEKDKPVVEKFFEPAFNWSNWQEYENARQHYMKQLGKDNSFTKTYLPPDTIIETNDGALAFIDYKKLKAKMDDIEIVPLTAEGDRVRYVAFLTYYMYKDEKDLVNLSALEPSKAIVQFTVSNDSSAESGRKVSEVEAWAGFSSSHDVE